jgi:hypothetical protein
MLMGAYDDGIDDQVFEVRIIRPRLEDAGPHALLALLAEALEDAVPLPEGFRQVAPGRVLTREHDAQTIATPASRN